MSVFLYMGQRYYHEFDIDLNKVKKISSKSIDDGVILFGPKIENNLIYG